MTLETNELINRLHKQLDILNAHPDFNESCSIIDILDAINEIQRLQSIIKDMQQVDDVLAPQSYVSHSCDCECFKDANRYRMLKELATKPALKFTLAVSKYDGISNYWQPCYDIDKAIDEAMTKSAQY